MPTLLQVPNGQRVRVSQRVVNNGTDHVTIRLSFILPYFVIGTDARDESLAPGIEASAYVEFVPDVDGVVSAIAESFPGRVVRREDVSVDVLTDTRFFQEVTSEVFP